MLSYRHSYHAGNHADVLKHLTLIALLRHLVSKDKPLTYLDSHSGAGLYDLESVEAKKLGEAQQGIVRLWQKPPPDPLVDDYLAQLRRMNPNGQLRYYPGSPAVALERLRKTDRAVLMELHNQEYQILRQNFQCDARVALHHRDAFEGMIALTPPSPSRGLALVDPSYELASDYEKAEHLMRKVHHRWPVGVLALWYPLLARSRDRSGWLKAGLTQGSFKSLLCAELTVREKSEGVGMHGSGILIANAPWQLDAKLQAGLSAISPLLCAPGITGARVHWLIKPA